MVKGKLAPEFKHEKDFMILDLSGISLRMGNYVTISDYKEALHASSPDRRGADSYRTSFLASPRILRAGQNERGENCYTAFPLGGIFLDKWAVDGWRQIDSVSPRGVMDLALEEAKALQRVAETIEKLPSDIADAIAKSPLAFYSALQWSIPGHEVKSWNKEIEKAARRLVEKRKQLGANLERIADFVLDLKIPRRFTGAALMGAAWDFGSVLLRDYPREFEAGKVNPSIAKNFFK